MMVVPLEVLSTGERAVVRFRTDFGTAIASWQTAPNAMTQRMYAEVDILPKLVLGENLALVSTSLPHSISSDTEHTMICGTVESVDSDGMTFIRLAPDCLLMADAERQALQPQQRIVITVAHSDLVVFT